MINYHVGKSGNMADFIPGLPAPTVETTAASAPAANPSPIARPTPSPTPRASATPSGTPRLPVFDKSKPGWEAGFNKLKEGDHYMVGDQEFIRHIKPANR